MEITELHWVAGSEETVTVWNTVDLVVIKSHWLPIWTLLYQHSVSRKHKQVPSDKLGLELVQDLEALNFFLIFF